MIITKDVTLTYENERGAKVNLTPIISNINNVFILSDATTQLQNEINADREIAWHGQTLNSFFTQSRYIEIRGFLNYRNEDKNNVYSYKRNIEKVFNLTLRGKLTYRLKSNLPNRFLDNCIPTSKVRFYEEKGVPCFVINLVANQPFWQEETATEPISFTQKSMFYPRSYPPIQYVPEVGVNNGKMFFGLRKPNLDYDLNNVGDVEAGFTIKFLARGHVENPLIKHLESEMFIKINITLERNEYIEIVSLPDRREVTIYKYNDLETLEKSNGFDNMATGSRFFLMEVGNQKIEFRADTNTSNLDVFLNYTPLYLGAEGRK